MTAPSCIAPKHSLVTAIRHALLPLLLAPLAVASGEPLETVTVIGVTPIPDRVVPAVELAGHGVVFDWQRIERTQALDLSQFLNRSHGSVFINEAQNNPLQPDVQLRGFTASPLLGLPQGLAVYQDGVRINEPFGDTVNWALIPQNAIDRITVMPGSNPVFGMNALGGSLAIETKNGFEHRGTELQALGGDFSRFKAEAQTGGTFNDRLAWFAAGTHLDEDGWRDFSPTRATQAFADLRYRSDTSTAALSVTHADTRLIGNGPSPVQLMAENREAIFTRPDLTRNRMSLVSLSGRRALREGLHLDVVAAYRKSDIRTLNGDDSDFEACEDDPEIVCEDEDEVALDPLGTPIAFSPAVEGATINRSRTRQDTYSLSAQLSLDAHLGGVGHRASIGASVDYNDVAFDASTELGRLDDTRNALGSGSYVLETFTDLDSRSKGYGLYAIDVMQVSEHVSVSVAGRFNVNTVKLRDQLGTALNGNHRFSRFNPAAGVTWQATDSVQLYASVGEASRVPSPAELTCADPDDPCRLPNAFLSDPPLQQVVSRTIEAGARGRVGSTHWHLGLFDTVNRDDILFISAGALTNQGYFDNVGRTRRRGIELSLNGQSAQERVRWYLDATFIDAEFRENFVVTSPNNPFAEEDEIPVQRGDRIPGLPRYLLKAGIDAQLTPRWSVAADYNHASSQYLRGDEGNLTSPLAGYGVLNLRTAWQMSEHLELFALVENVTNERYETFGTFGEADDVLGDDYSDTRFISPGPPRAVWVGLSMSWR